MKKIRERSLRLESLEDRMLLAVTAGGFETAAAACVAAPLPTEATQLATPTNFRAASSANSSIDLSWDAVANASGYTVYWQTTAATAWRSATTTNTSHTIRGLVKTTLYNLKVVANGDGVNYTDSEESVVLQRYPDPSQPPVFYGTVVTTLSDIEDGVNMTLRQAVANASRTGETVTFADGLSGTIDLAPNGHIKDVFGDVIIDGDNRITITNSSTDGQGRLFLLYNYEEYISNISFKNITLTGATATTYKEFNRGGMSGETEDGAGFGSAIMLYSPSSKVSATFENVTITDCLGTMNGTLYLFGVSDLTMTNCTITGNRTGSGGGFFLQECDNFTITDCVFDGNIANDNGGGVVLNDFANGVIDNCQITNNACYGDSDSSSLRGGGLYIDGFYEGGAYQYTVSSNLTLYDTVISGNVIDADPEAGEGLYTADGKGGGICVYNTNLTTNECTISDNHIIHTGNAQGGGVFAIHKDEYGYELTSKNGSYRPYNGTVRFNMTYLTGNTLGTFDVYPGGVYGMTGAAVWAAGNLIFVDSLVADNALYGNTTNGMVASAVYDYCNNIYANDQLIGMSYMFAYYTTFAGNKAYSLNGSALGEESGAFRDFGNSYFWGSTILGNQMINMNGTAGDASDDIVTDRDFFTFALEENLVALPRFLSCAINEDTMLYPSWFEEHADWHYGWLIGTYYDDAAFTQVSAGQAKDGGAYLKDDSVYVTDYRSLYNDYDAGDYTLAPGAAAIDAMNMDLWSSGFGYEFDIRGEGYYRLVNDIADIGVYEFQVAKPTFEVTIIDYTGDYDGQAHTVSLSGLEDGDVVKYSADGEVYSESVVAYTDPGTYTVYVSVARSGYEDFYGAGTVTINDVAPVEPLAAPVITTGNRGVYVSYGANRHYIQWGAVANASGYEVEYTTDGNSWTTVAAEGTSAVIGGLTYGLDVDYRVRALGDGTSYADSDWSRTKTFNVCPMDINNDADIGGLDRNILAVSWGAEEGDDEYQFYADINADGDVGGLDRNFLGSNWGAEAGDDDLTYPRPVRADAVFAAYESGDLDIDFDVF